MDVSYILQMFVGTDQARRGDTRGKWEVRQPGEWVAEVGPGAAGSALNFRR